MSRDVKVPNRWNVIVRNYTKEILLIQYNDNKNKMKKIKCDKKSDVVLQNRTLTFEDQIGIIMPRYAYLKGAMHAYGYHLVSADIADGISDENDKDVTQANPHKITFPVKGGNVTFSIYSPLPNSIAVDVTLCAGKPDFYDGVISF